MVRGFDGACRDGLCALGAPDRPNILFLMADQFRADCIGAEGNRVIRTPNLDRLADGRCPIPLCVYLHAFLHAGPVGDSHRPVAVAPRDARDGADGSAPSERDAADAA